MHSKKPPEGWLPEPFSTWIVQRDRHEVTPENVDAVAAALRKVESAGTPAEKVAAWHGVVAARGAAAEQVRETSDLRPPPLPEEGAQRFEGVRVYDADAGVTYEVVAEMVAGRPRIRSLTILPAVGVEIDWSVPLPVERLARAAVTPDDELRPVPAERKGYPGAAAIARLCAEVDAVKGSRRNTISARYHVTEWTADQWIKKARDEGAEITYIRSGRPRKKGQTR